MASGALPHTYPFRFVDRIVQAPPSDATALWKGSARTRISTGGRAAMGEGWHSPLLLVEAIAQAALLLEAKDEKEAEEGRLGFLAGIDDFEVVRAPRAGETLSVDVTLAASFGPIVKFVGEVFADGERIAQGSVLVRKPVGRPHLARS
jgi:3-hydroxyacyl-[acyl-carrier-protein] dehydratase